MQIFCKAARQHHHQLFLHRAPWCWGSCRDRRPLRPAPSQAVAGSQEVTDFRLVGTFPSVFLPASRHLHGISSSLHHCKEQTTFFARANPRAEVSALPPQQAKLKAQIKGETSLLPQFYATAATHPHPVAPSAPGQAAAAVPGGMSVCKGALPTHNTPAPWRHCLG